MPRNYLTNSEMKWNFVVDVPYPKNVPFLALIEEDTCDPRSYPWVSFIMFDESRPIGQRRILLDRDVDINDDDFLHQYYTIVAWRLPTDHAGTFDVILSKDSRYKFLLGK